jgi:hypothetical protein
MLGDVLGRTGGLCSSCALSRARTLTRPFMNHLVYDHVCISFHALI